MAPDGVVAQSCGGEEKLGERLSPSREINDLLNLIAIQLMGAWLLPWSQTREEETAAVAFLVTKQEVRQDPCVQDAVQKNPTVSNPSSK